jgi:predicted transcriptional regulator
MENLIILEQGLKAFRQNPLSVLEGQVFWHLTQILTITGNVVVTSDLSNDLKLSHERVGLGIKKLREAGFIVRGVKFGRSYHYKLNPTFFRLL